MEERPIHKRRLFERITPFEFCSAELATQKKFQGKGHLENLIVWSIGPGGLGIEIDKKPKKVEDYVHLGGEYFIRVGNSQIGKGEIVHIEELDDKVRLGIKYLESPQWA